MGVLTAAIQMDCPPGRVAENLDRADELLREAWQAGADLAVLPELFNTGYEARPDYARMAEPLDGTTIARLAHRSREFGLVIAAGFAETDGVHVYNTLALCQPDGRVHHYRKRSLVFWEPFRFRGGREPVIVPTRFGRIGLAICADMIEARTWRDYRGAIDLAVIASAWPEFVDRRTDRPLRLFGLGRLGPLCRELPLRISADLGVPVVLANQSGPAMTCIPGWPRRIPDRFAGVSGVIDHAAGTIRRAGREERDAVVLGEVRLPTSRSRRETGQGPGPRRWASTIRSASAASSSEPEL